ncbi:uncharacterized protein LOC111629864, partial [Centruroides sculpturatus]|uniref:uncharacterized protein LOC111629864 n=1 Tax=Centruroides sculpturatus TaxID=218467 RepID=UPI000C6E9FE0
CLQSVYLLNIHYNHFYSVYKIFEIKPKLLIFISGGSLGNSRLTLSSRDTPLSQKSASLDFVDESIQVDLSADTITYDSDDEMVKRRVNILRNKKGHPIYSREDIREQYCINKKEEEVLENARTNRFFGCLANQQESPCTKNSILFSCMKKKANSDENLYMPETPTAWTSSSKTEEDEDEFAGSGFRRRPRTFCVTDPKIWADSDDQSRTKTKLASSASLGSQHSTDSEGFSRCIQRPSQLSIGRQEIAPSQSVDALNDTYSRRELYRRSSKTPDFSLDDRRPKHVSFDSSSMIRSNTVAGGLEEVDVGPAATSTPLNSQKRNFSPTHRHHSQERLLDLSGSKSFEMILSRPLVIKPRRAMLKTQATQTELTFKARFLLPAYLTLSPRATAQYRQKLQSQRNRSVSRLTKSRSAHGVLGSDSDEEIMEVDMVSKHPKLVRSATRHSLTKHRSFDAQQEIMVSFKPVSPPKSREVLIGERPKISTKFDIAKDDIVKIASPVPIMTSSDSAPSIPVDTHPISMAVSESEDMTEKTYSGTEEDKGKDDEKLRRDSSSSMVSSETMFIPQRKARYYMTALLDSGGQDSSFLKSSELSRTKLKSKVTPVKALEVETESPTVTTDGGIQTSQVSTPSAQEVPVISKQEFMTSPDSESSSSIFTERETSRSELSTSSSSHVLKSEPSNKSDAEVEEVSESSEYVTATDLSYQTRREKTQTVISKNSTEEGHTSFESASSASIFSSPSSRSSQIKSPVPLPRDDESSDESTKKEAVSSDSESGQMSPIQEGPDERALDVTPVPEPSSEQSSHQDAQTVIENKSDATSEELLESISSSPLNREESESSDSSSVFSGVQTDLPPIRTFRPEDISEVSEESNQEWKRRRQFHLMAREEIKPNGVRSSSSDYLPSETTTPSYDSTTSGSFILESIGGESLSEDIIPEQLSLAIAAPISQEQEEIKSDELETEKLILEVVKTISEQEEKKDKLEQKEISEPAVCKEHTIPSVFVCDVTSSSSSIVSPETQPTDVSVEISSKEELSATAAKEETQFKSGVSEGAIPKQRDADQETKRRRERIRIKVDTVESQPFLGSYLSPDDRDLPSRRPRSLSRSPDKEEEDQEQKLLCSQCGEKLRDTAHSPFGWDRSYQRQFWEPTADILRHCRDRPSSSFGDSYGFPRYSPYSPRWGDLPVVPGAEDPMFRDEEEDAGVHLDSYRISLWIYVSESDELAVWKLPLVSDCEYLITYSNLFYVDLGLRLTGFTSCAQHLSPEGQQSDTLESRPSLQRSDSSESTSSEQDFLKQYQAVTHRMIHRKSSVEMYKRLLNKTFESLSMEWSEAAEQSFISAKKALSKATLFHHPVPGAKLCIWVDAAVGRALMQHNTTGTHCFYLSKTETKSMQLLGRLQNFILRLPFVLFILGTPAETCGLEVGDIIININGINVLEAPHSEVVKIAHTGTDVLHVEVARTCHVLAPIINQTVQNPLLSGYLQRLSIGNLSAQRWCRRWFMLKPDNSLYWYRSPEDHEPLGALALQSHVVSRVPDAGSPHAFRVTKYGGSTYYFSADDEDTAARWISALTQVATSASKVDPYLDLILRNVQLPPISISNPDCHGYLGKLSQRWKTWKRRYFILKDASLYFYTDRNATTALGMFLLHGYKVQSCTVSGKKNTYEAIPPEPRLKHLYFLADTENDKKRWLAAFEYSIDRWIKVG